MSIILVAIVAPSLPVRLAYIENTPDAMLAITKGPRLEYFPVVSGDDSIVGICNEEGLLMQLPFSRFNHATCARIAGTFIVAGDRNGRDGRKIVSLEHRQLLDIVYHFGHIENPELFHQEPPQCLDGI